MDAIRKDVRYALRILALNPGFTAIALIALTLGIGANTAIFSLVNAVLLKPLPYPDAERLVKVWGQFEGIGIPNNRNWISGPEFVDIQRMNRSFSGIAAIGSADFNLTGGATPERLQAGVVSPSFFSILGVNAELGRVFLPEEDRPGNGRVVLLSHGLWERRFGSNRAVIGERIKINGEDYLVAGVLPAWFQYAPNIDIWAPLIFTPNDLASRGAHQFEMLARIKPGLSLEQARADMQTVTNQIIDEARGYPYRHYNFKLLLSPLIEEYVGDIRKPLWILTAAVGFVLLIACANVANLLLVRASTRQREIAIRTALGAGRARLVRQLLTESLLLSLFGGAAGLIAARLSLRALISLGEKSFPRVSAASMDWTVLAFTMGICVVTGLLFGIAPAFQVSRFTTHESLKEGGRSTTEGAASQRLRTVLVIGEVALSLVLLAGAGLLLKSFMRLLNVDAGFRPEHVLTMRISLPEQRYSQPDRVRSFYRNLTEQIRRLPGVTAAGGVSVLPLSGSASSGTTTIDSPVVSGSAAEPEADRRDVLPGYFEAMGIELLRGRYFDERDNERAAPAAIVDETLANTFWPHMDAIGRRLKLGGNTSKQPWMTVVGVVKHVRYRTLEANSRVTVYFPHAQRPFEDMSLTIRTPGDPLTLAPAVERTVAAADPDQPVYKVASMEQIMADSVARRRLSMLLLAFFAAVALLLAGVGIYGVISYSVMQRTQEMGVRMALGASRADLLKLVLGHSLWMAGAGIVAGSVASIFLTRFLATQLFDVKPGDPATFAAVAGAMIVTALAASFVPARRATSVDPMRALRQE